MTGETQLKLADQREFKLVLDMEAMLTVEDNANLPLAKVMERAQSGFMTAIAAIAQAAFARHHPTMTRSDVLEIMRSDTEALEAALAKATENAFPDPKAGNVKPKAKRQRGKTSGSNGAKQD